jgi:hypothetical protein
MASRRHGSQPRQSLSQQPRARSRAGRPRARRSPCPRAGAGGSRRPARPVRDEHVADDEGPTAMWSMFARLPGMRRSCRRIAMPASSRSRYAASRASPSAPCAHAWVDRFGPLTSSASGASRPQRRRRSAASRLCQHGVRWGRRAAVGRPRRGRAPGRRSGLSRCQAEAWHRATPGMRGQQRTGTGDALDEHGARSIEPGRPVCLPTGQRSVDLSVRRRRRGRGRVVDHGVQRAQLGGARRRPRAGPRPCGARGRASRAGAWRLEEAGGTEGAAQGATAQPRLRRRCVPG